MKKQIIFLFALGLLLSTISLSAQMELRLLGGINSSTLSMDFRDAEFKDGWGYQFGADFQIGNRWFVQAGLQFESTTNPVEDATNGMSLSDLEVQRLRVPLYVGHRFFDRDNVLNFRVFTGPNASLIVEKSLGESLSFDENAFSDAVFGWNIGAGVDFAFLFADLGYMFGINNVFDTQDGDVQNNLFFFNAGLRLKF